MKTQTDKEYFRSRALDELASEEAATDPVVSRVRRELAERYELLVTLSSDTPKLR
ncbi:MAG: hypothetical protein V4530_17575 [Pseudomonadota bacterium]